MENKNYRHQITIFTWKIVNKRCLYSTPKEAGVTSGHIWKLRHCLYRLLEAARQFYDSVKEVLITLGCCQCKLDLALFIYTHNNKLSGIIALHVDDFLHTGDCHFKKDIIQPLTKKFVAGKLDEGSFNYVGFQIMQDNQGIAISQPHYVQNTDEITVTPERSTQKMMNFPRQRNPHIDPL